MRRLQLATLLFTIVSLVATGCRQTTGPTSSGPLTPLGPLAPIGAGQSPTLGPFGGPTRVTPPATGSYVAPNDYMGGVVPIGQTNAGISPSGRFAPQASGDVIGSGVQVAGWNETNAVTTFDPSLGAQQSTGTSPLGANAAAPTDPRSGGMQVIDLTGAPAPPGYRMSAPSFNQPIPAASPPNQNWQQGPPNQTLQSQPFQSQPFQNQQFQNQPVQSQPSQNQPFENQRGLRPIITPSAAEIANGLTPVPTVTREFPINPQSVDPNFPRTARGPIEGPSTEPVNSGNLNGSQQNLPWRRPGTRF